MTGQRHDGTDGMRSRRTRAAALWATVAIVPAGCTPFGPCLSDRIEVAFDATVTSGGADQTWPLRGQVTPTNLDPPAYQRLVGALIEDTVSAAGAVWTMDAGLEGESGYLAIQFGADPTENAALDIGGAFDGGGWGFVSPPDLTVSDGTTSYRFQGTIGFSRRRERVACD
jgi:hypothetical protein